MSAYIENPVCSKCGSRERIPRYRSVDKKRQNKPETRCRPCFNEYQKEWRSRRPEPHRQRIRKHNFLKYGIDPIEAERLVSTAKHCQICMVDKPGGGGGWHLDHDHKSKKIRGVLCMNCNRGLGHFKDDVCNLLNAVDYLNGYPK